LIVPIAAIIVLIIALFMIDGTGASEELLDLVRLAIYVMIAIALLPLLFIAGMFMFTLMADR